MSERNVNEIGRPVPRTCGELIDLIRENHAEGYRIRVADALPSATMFVPTFFHEAKIMLIEGEKDDD